MKKLILTSAVVLAVFSMGGASSKKVQCGVSNAQIISYLVNCNHHHTSACCVTDIPGTCNSKANIEMCGVATVYVSDGIIVGHADNGIGSCSIPKKVESI